VSNLSDSKGPTQNIPKGHKKLSQRRKHERKAIFSLKRNSKINLKKTDKGTTTVIMDTAQKIEEGL